MFGWVECFFPNKLLVLLYLSTDVVTISGYASIYICTMHMFVCHKCAACNTCVVLVNLCWFQLFSGTNCRKCWWWCCSCSSSSYYCHCLYPDLCVLPVLWMLHAVSILMLLLLP